MQFTATLRFDADDMTAAEDTVSTWVVTPGTTVVSLLGSAFSDRVPIEVTEGGAVSTGAQPQAELESP